MANWGIFRNDDRQTDKNSPIFDTEKDAQDYAKIWYKPTSKIRIERLTTPEKRE